MQGDTESHYLANVGNYKFNVSVYIKKQGNVCKQFTILVGGTKKGCVEVTGSTLTSSIQSNDERFLSFLDPSRAMISSVSYDKKCSLGNTLERGTGTRMMLKFAMNFVKKHFGITTFRLDDSSNFPCYNKSDPENIQPRWIDLAKSSIAVYGKTWYEKHFNAQLEDKNAYLEYRNNTMFFSNSSTKPNIEIFFSKYASEYKNDKTFVEAYNSTSTFNEFFQKLMNTHDNFCDVTYKWIARFVDDHVRLQREWIIYQVPEIASWVEERLSYAPVYNNSINRGGRYRNNIDPGIDFEHD